MITLKTIFIAIVLLSVAVAAMAIKIITNKDGQFSGGSCKSNPALRNGGIGCGCGAGASECKT